MPKKKKDITRVFDAPAAEVTLQPITETVEKNFMPYAMSVIISRAIPEIDGFKPSHRKLLYTMYKMGLLSGQRTKSANVVGQTMRLNPHGDSAIYETMVRLTRGNESLLHPFVDSKGSFGKHYSTDMAYAASRYTEVKLDPICAEVFGGIDKNSVDFVPNYDNTMQEPKLLPTAFPNVLISPNIGVAVGMACSICSFNLGEICEGTIKLLKNPKTTTDELLDIVRAPDFSSGANLIYDRDSMREIFETGRGSVKLRSRYVYDKDNNCIEIIEIPYSTSIELIMKKLTALIKEGKLKEIADFRDEIDLNGFKLTLDLRRGTDPEKLMTKLFKMTPLQDSFDCNFNILVDGSPRQMGVREILNEWIRFRVNSIRRELTYDLGKKSEKLNLLVGLGKISLDIDRAIKIIRETKYEKDVVPRLMEGFDLDRAQAEYVAEIKLRYLNREYLMNRMKEVATLKSEIDEIENTIASETRTRTLIAKQLKEIKDKYAIPRKTKLVFAEDIKEYVEEEYVENYTARLIFTKEGYFKKITMQSLRGNDEQKMKEGDAVIVSEDASNTDELLFFSDRAQVYKAKVSEFDTTKASVLGDYVPAKLGFDEGERAVAMKIVKNYDETQNMIFVFENGKGVRVPLAAYETKANRRKLTGAYSDVSPLVAAIGETEGAGERIAIFSDSGRALAIDTALIPKKTTRSSQGVALFDLKKKSRVIHACKITEDDAARFKRYAKNKIPSPGVALSDEDAGVAQINLFE